jgi:hypothetical protein
MQRQEYRNLYGRDRAVEFHDATGIAGQSWRPGDDLLIEYTIGGDGRLRFRATFYRDGNYVEAVHTSWFDTVAAVNEWLLDGPLAPPRQHATKDDEVPL